jgi:hypothetical protein
MFHIDRREKWQTNFKQYPYTAMVEGDRYFIRRGDVEGWVAQAGLAGVPCSIDWTGKRFYARTLRQLDMLLQTEAIKIRKGIYD